MNLEKEVCNCIEDLQHNVGLNCNSMYGNKRLIEAVIKSIRDILDV